MTEVTHHTPEEIAEQVRQLAGQLQMAGRKDLLLKAIGAPLLEELFAHQEGVSGHDGRVCCQLLHHQRTYAETRCRLVARLV